ncbi:dialkylresorcinol condensing enzyme DarA [Galbibacter sp. EGI 63066]|uniref:dialkylrecorsinol condensing enzyme DarA n=1 Tax=Galbibacter sp. EGI 63066 TaxID=2993559 RepID=UPI002248CB5C|nr:dialkylrecorsinol condensing enzyme DarA [Galbibacter sp. EGI 63066]MCX2678329.1 dialkylresorcinol condensing enzyme DarA [Galbibacter sp. EGI 63066]
MKNILAVHYSQSGQLSEIMKSVLSTMDVSNDIKVTSLEIKMEEPYPFPWSKKAFFNVFPESFLQVPAKIKPIPQSILDQKYDLIVLGYQVWYLSPSIPTNSFLNLPEVKQLFSNTPVVTVIGCRNMWAMTHQKVKKLLQACNAQLVGNIALVDRHINHISVITIVQWMFSGKKERYLKIFPKPGVSAEDIKGASKFGKTVANHLQNDNLQSLNEALLEQKSASISSFLVFADKRANILFGKWANFIQSKGEPGGRKRNFWLKMFKFYLLIAIWVIMPIVFILFLLGYVPFYGAIKKSKQRIYQLN